MSEPDAGFPGADLIRDGVEDLRRGSTSVAALVVSIGYPRLRRLGIELPEPPLDMPEHHLYDLLRRENEATAHSRYNALIRRLVSFERAVECAG
ncbi:MAG: hypothetical protein ACRDJO_08235 [Actinomycetota bacterium]